MASIALLVCFVASVGLAHGAGLLFPHMAGNGDTKFMPEYDDYNINVPLNDTYGFYDNTFNNVYISTNGYVTFDMGLSSYVPYTMDEVTHWSYKMIAPLFSDILLDNQPPNNHIWYRETQDQTMLDKAKNAIQPYFHDCGGPGFEPTSVVIVTWQRVKPYCNYWYWGYQCDGYYWYYWYYWYYYDYYYYYGDYGYKREQHAKDDVREPQTPPEPAKPTEEERRAMMENMGEIEHTGDRNDLEGINGFQLVLATDGTMTFAIFNMHTIEWTCCWEYNTSGFSAGDHSRSCDLPGSGTSAVDQLTSTTNVGKDGRWIYRVDDCYVFDPQCTVCNSN